jgi:hypothetical protein
MLRAADDCAAASWIVENLHGCAHDVGSVVPPVFNAYVRVFHPGWVGGRDGRPVTWSEIASANGRVTHTEMQFHALVPEGHIDLAGNVLKGQPGVWDAPPDEGIARRGDHRAASSDTPTAHADGGTRLVCVLGWLGDTDSPGTAERALLSSPWPDREGRPELRRRARSLARAKVFNTGSRPVAL